MSKSTAFAQQLAAGLFAFLPAMIANGGEPRGALAQVQTPPPPSARARAKGSPFPGARKGASGPDIEGTFRVTGDTSVVHIRRMRGDIFFLDSSAGWEGVGMLEGSIYRGVFRYRAGSGPGMAGVMGRHTIDWKTPDEPVVRIAYESPRSGELDERWQRVQASRDLLREKSKPDPPGTPRETGPPGEPAPPKPGGRPAFGDYVYVDELPEAIHKVAPAYPDPQGRVEAIVMVQALVLEDGSVGECRVMESVPMLDEAAIACVRQWRFKPAMAKGVPVAVWVAVPIRFTPH